MNRAYIENAQQNPSIPKSVIPPLLPQARPVHHYVPVDVFVPGCTEKVARNLRTIEGLVGEEKVGAACADPRRVGRPLAPLVAEGHDRHSHSADDDVPRRIHDRDVRRQRSEELAESTPVVVPVRQDYRNM